MRHWKTQVPEFVPLGEQAFSSIVVSTVDSMRLTFLTDKLVQQGRQPQMREHLAMRQLRSLVRQLERRRCTLEAVSMTLWLQPRRPLAMLEDRRQLRLRQRRRRSRRQTLGIVGTMRAVMRLRRRVVVAGALWCTTRRAWVRPRRQREAHQVMQVRRLAGKRCEVVRARWTLPRQQVWQLVRRW